MDIEQFYKTNYRIVFSYLYSLCQDVHTAEDLTSETFLRAIQRIDSYDDRIKASTWLCAIGRNLFRNELKKEIRRTDLEKFILTDPDSPEDILLQKEQIHLLAKHIEALEEWKRQVFLLRRQGMSYREIGDALGKSENWARVNYFRIKEAILHRMEEPE